MLPLRHPRMLLSGDLPNPLTTAKQPPINRHPRMHPFRHPRMLFSGDLPITLINTNN